MPKVGACAAGFLELYELYGCVLFARVDSNGDPANGNAAGIDILSSAVNTVVADNTAWDNRRDVILVAGTGTDVVNNTV